MDRGGVSTRGIVGKSLISNNTGSPNQPIDNTCLTAAFGPKLPCSPAARSVHRRNGHVVIGSGSTNSRRGHEAHRCALLARIGRKLSWRTTCRRCAGNRPSRLARHRDAADPLRRFPVRGRLSGWRHGRPAVRNPDALPGDRGLPEPADAGERGRAGRGAARLRCDEADPGGDLGKPDGRGDGAADRQHRDSLCHRPSRPEGRRPDGGRRAAAHARRNAGQPAALARRRRPAGSRQG